jgi:phage N-6-adenine-methyltransferase
LGKEQKLVKQPMGLQRVEQARALLVQAKTLDAVKDLHDQAAAMVTYLKERGLAGDAHLDAWEVLQLTNRRLGELCAELEHHPTGGGRPKKTGTDPIPVSKRAKLQELGISKMQASRWEQLARLDEPDFAKWLEDGRERVLKRSDPDGLQTSRNRLTGSHDSDSYGTPEDVIALEVRVLGHIGLDPASNAAAQKIVGAKKFWSKRDDALSRPWKSTTVHLNPPYSHPLVLQFVQKFVEEHQKKRFESGVVLVNNATETEWFQLLLAEKYPVCFPDRRISFLLGAEPMTQNRQAQAFFCAGPARVRQRFVEVFSEIGQCR